MALALATTNLTKYYGTTCAVDHLSLQVREGEIYAFLGLNGAGKTTTIRMVLDMVRPTSGTATIFGLPVGTHPHRTWGQVGHLVESPSAYPELTVRENLEVARRLRQATDPRAVDRIIERLSLSSYANRAARTLSLGNAQRLGLAKAMLHAPRLLILDEPANGLDPAGVVEVRNMLRALAHEQGVTVFMSSHILGEVARLADRVGIIHQGCLLEELDAHTLRARRRGWLEVSARDLETAATVLASHGFMVQRNQDGGLRLEAADAVAHPDTVAEILVRGGVPPTKLSVEHEDLEDYFLRLTTEMEEVGG